MSVMWIIGNVTIKPHDLKLVWIVLVKKCYWDSHNTIVVTWYLARFGNFYCIVVVVLRIFLSATRRFSPRFSNL